MGYVIIKNILDVLYNYLGVFVFLFGILFLIVFLHTPNEYEYNKQGITLLDGTNTELKIVWDLDKQSND